MKVFTKRDKRTENEKKVDETIQKLVEEADTPEKVKAVLELLEKRRKPKKGVSADTVAIIAANLLGIVLILSHEKLNVISTKALGFVMRGRV